MSYISFKWCSRCETRSKKGSPSCNFCGGHVTVFEDTRAEKQLLKSASHLKRSPDDDTASTLSLPQRPQQAMKPEHEVMSLKGRLIDRYSSFDHPYKRQRIGQDGSASRNDDHFAPASSRSSSQQSNIPSFSEFRNSGTQIGRQLKHIEKPTCCYVHHHPLTEHVCIERDDYSDPLHREALIVALAADAEHQSLGNAKTPTTIQAAMSQLGKFAMIQHAYIAGITTRDALQEQALEQLTSNPRLVPPSSTFFKDLEEHFIKVNLHIFDYLKIVREKTKQCYHSLCCMLLKDLHSHNLATGFAKCTTSNIFQAFVVAHLQVLYVARQKNGEPLHTPLDDTYLWPTFLEKVNKLTDDLFCFIHAIQLIYDKRWAFSEKQPRFQPVARMLIFGGLVPKALSAERTAGLPDFDLADFEEGLTAVRAGRAQVPRNQMQMVSTSTKTEVSGKPRVYGLWQPNTPGAKV